MTSYSARVTSFMFASIPSTNGRANGMPRLGGSYPMLMLYVSRCYEPTALHYELEINAVGF
jgi:hypothetical protein